MVGCGSQDRCEADRSATTLLPIGVQVHADNCRVFDVDDREVWFSHVEYGELMDCPSGCFASHVCAVEDDGVVLLHYAAWTRPEERPVGIETLCPDLVDTADGSGETWPSCEPPGLSHPINDVAAFRDFAAGEIGRGPFRLCFNRYGEGGPL